MIVNARIRNHPRGDVLGKAIHGPIAATVKMRPVLNACSKAKPNVKAQQAEVGRFVIGLNRLVFAFWPHMLRHACGSPWPTRDTIPAPCKPTWVTGGYRSGVKRVDVCLGLHSTSALRPDRTFKVSKSREGPT